MNLPVELTRYFADSKITVDSYDALYWLLHSSSPTIVVYPHWCCRVL